MRTLVLTLEYPNRASYYEDWRDAFLAEPRFGAVVANVFSPEGRAAALRALREADLAVVLHACTADSLDHIHPLETALAERRCQLVSFVGNEVNLPWSPLGPKIDWLKRVRPDVVATQLLLEAGEYLYGDCGARIIALPHALNPQAFIARTPQSARPIDIGARSFRYLAYIGDDDRNRIYDFFATRRFDPPLALDFSTERRFDRAGWAAFLDRCKATIATEAGSWFLERDDATVTAIRAWAAGRTKGLVIRADSPMRRFAQRLPYPLKALLRRLLRKGPLRHEALAAEDLDASEVHARFFAGRDRAPVYSKCISSRHFDAMGTKTAQIMFPGRYSDILRPGEHYIELAADFANIDDVLRRLRDAEWRRAMVERAHALAMGGHTYRHRLEALAKTLAI